MGDRVAKTDLFDQFARVGKALGNGKRLELLDLLAQGERTVESLAAAAGLGLSSASAHLQTLRRAHLVDTRRKGTRIYYSLAGEDVGRLYVLLRSVAQTHLADVESARIAYLGPTTDPTGAAGVPPREVTRQELLARARSGDVVVLDVRPTEEYDAAHIPGAVSIPFDVLPDRLDELPADAEVVAYCRGAYCVLAHDAVRLLHIRGRKAARLADGMLEWRLAGLPTVAGAA